LWAKVLLLAYAGISEEPQEKIRKRFGNHFWAKVLLLAYAGIPEEPQEKIRKRFRNHFFHNRKFHIFELTN
jgi:hypothetical protein